MERFELIVILVLFMGLMFGLGWFGYYIYSYFFGRNIEKHNFNKEWHQRLNKVQHQYDEIKDQYTQQEQLWQEELDKLHEENNQYLQTHRFYQDKIYELEQRLRDQDK